MHGIFPDPVLYQESGGIGLRPLDANAIDWLHLGEIKYHPLRMERITFPGEMLS
jgi:hypothetical protein